MSLRRWLARLAFSFLILAGVFGWSGRAANARGESPHAHYAIATLFAAAGILGLRERHQPPGD
jgi:hypothetical protein